MLIPDKNMTLASLCLGGEYIALIPAEMNISSDSYSVIVDGLRIILDFIEYAPGFFRWTVRLRNEGEKRTEQITELYGMDLAFPVKGEAIWESLHGDICGLESYLPLKETIGESPIMMHPEGGRSSTGDYFPWFDITDEQGSNVFAIGWTGQWKCSVSRVNDTVRIRAGFEDCDFYLEPGEEARSCGALVCAGEGMTLTETRQRFRRLFREKLSPAAKYGGKLEIPLSLQVFDRYFRRNPNWATEDGQLECIYCADKCGYFNTYWLDAAWFRDGFPTGVGNYTFEPTFPHGLLPVSKAAHNKGLDFMVWFEPERNDFRSDTVREHPEFMLESGWDGDTNRLFNLSDEKAFLWLRNTLISMLRDNGIDTYRQDFNMSPLEYWRRHDESEGEGRKGYTEIRYITNLYRLWDDIMKEFPGMLIDNCSSGGRRIDFEMCTRSVPMWRSDTGCSPASESAPSDLFNQNQTLGLSRYLPYHSIATWQTDANTFRSAATMGIACNFDVMNDDFDSEDAKKPLAEFVKLRPMWDGDFIPLTEAGREDNIWSAWQLSCGDRGFCEFFRRRNSAEDKMSAELSDIDESAVYSVTVSDNNYNRTEMSMTGAELQKFTAVLPEPRTSMILMYEKN